MEVLDRPDRRVGVEGDRVPAVGTQLCEGRRQRGQPSNVVCPRTSSSWSSPGPCSPGPTGTTDLANTPAAHAAAALCWVSRP